MRVNPKGNFVSFKRKNGYNDRGRKISTNLIQKLKQITGRKFKPQ